MKVQKSFEDETSDTSTTHIYKSADNARTMDKEQADSPRGDEVEGYAKLSEEIEDKV